ncbi:MAG: hypothetical protein VX523_02980 [Chloroflexota bacterium]|nr:hypothetical protein [Chloroflexota bacterium]
MPKINLLKKLSKISLFTFIFATLLIGISDSEKISAQMPGGMPGGMMGQMMGAMGMQTVPSECRSNPGTGEVFCELKMDISMMSMTTTYAPFEYYEGQGVWFQGCMLPGQQYENYEAAWIERQYVGPSPTDPANQGTHIFIRGNMPTEPGQQEAKCKYQFFLNDSPLVKPGGPYHNPQWEADQETQKMYEEADNIRREAERKRAEEELLRAKQQAELEAQLAEEQRKQQAQQNQGNNQGIGNIFGQGPVGNIFGNAFQAPPDDEVPIGPFINLTTITTEDRWKVMECIASTIERDVGMSYEQAYMDFAFPLGVRMIWEPDFYYPAVTNCMQLSFGKLLSGGWGNQGGGGTATGTAPRADLNAMMEACIVPHLSDNLNIPRNIIMDDMVTVETGKRSVSKEEMLAAYDCWIHWDQNLRMDPSAGYFPLDSDLLVTFVFGDQEIQGQAYMIDGVADAQGFDRNQAERVVGDLVNFAVGRSDQWGFLESDASPQHKNEVVNRVIGCNQELDWLRDYLMSVNQNPAAEAYSLNFDVLQEDWMRECNISNLTDWSGDEFRAVEQYDLIIDGLINDDDPTEVINRPLAEQQFNSLIECAQDMNGDELKMDAWQPFIRQHTILLQDFTDGGYFDHLVDFTDPQDPNNDEKKIARCMVERWTKTNFQNAPREVVNDAFNMTQKIFYIGGNVEEKLDQNQRFDQGALDHAHECLGDTPEFDWVRKALDPNWDYEPFNVSDIFLGGGNSQKSAADFRQTIQTNESNKNNPGNMVQGSLAGGGALENMRLELVNMTRNSAAEDCMVANLARAKGETENYIKTSYMGNLVWDPQTRPTNKERTALSNCESQIRSSTQGKGGLDALLKLGRSGDPDYLSEPDDSQRACMVNEYIKTFGYMIESSGANPEESAAKAVSEFSMPGTFNGFHPLVGEKAPNLRPPSAIELDAISQCKLVDLYVYEGSRLRKLIPGVDTSDLPIGELASPTGLAIMGIMITLFFSVLQMIRGK